MLEESRRRHGVLGRREGESPTGVVGELGRELFGGSGKDGDGKVGAEGGEGSRRGRSEEEERLRVLKGGK